MPLQWARLAWVGEKHIKSAWGLLNRNREEPLIDNYIQHLFTYHVSQISQNAVTWTS